MLMKSYQNDHVKNIGRKIVERLAQKTPDSNHPQKTTKIRFLLKAPTGAGKTLMLSEIIRQYLSHTCVLVLSPGAGNLEEQTEQAIRRNLEGTDITVSSIDPTVFTHPAPAGSVFVKNWESLCGKDKRTGEYKNILTRNAETKNVFDWVSDTVNSNIPLVIIIDEAHYGNEKDATSINDFLNNIDSIVVNHAGYSPIVIEATATPNSKKTDVVRVVEEVTYGEVIDAGLMRKNIILNDGLNQYQGDESLDVERVLLELAWERLNVLDEAYAEAGSPYHALLGVQIPNSVLGKECRERVVQFFKEKNVTAENGELVEYFNEHKTDNIATLNRPDSPARVLIYKQAIAMGWDCPRAQVLVGFRHIKSHSFSTQNLGRFLRTTEARHYTVNETPNFEMLNSTFVYSNETPEGINSEEDFANGNLSFTDRLPLNSEAQELVKHYNSLRLPTTFIKRSVNTTVNHVDLTRLVSRESKKWFPTFVNKTIDGETVAEGIVNSYDLDTGNAQVSYGEDNRNLVKSDSQISVLFTQKVTDVLRYNTVNIPLYASIARVLVPRLLSLPVVTETFHGNKTARMRGLLAEENWEQVQEFINILLQDDFFVQDDTAIPVNSSRLVKTGSHHLPDAILVNSSNPEIVGTPAEFSLYSREVEGGLISRSADSGARFKPEILFEKTCLNLTNSGVEAGKISDRFSLKFYYKNPSFVTDGVFHLGLQFQVSYNEGGEQKRANFFPDYILFIHDNQSNDTFPVIVEVKDATGGHNSKELLEAKRKATETYMEKTGVPMVMVHPNTNNTEFYIMGTNTTFTNFLSKVDTSLIVGANNDLSWLEKLGE